MTMEASSRRLSGMESSDEVSIGDWVRFERRDTGALVIGSVQTIRAEDAPLPYIGEGLWLYTDAGKVYWRNVLEVRK